MKRQPWARRLARALVSSDQSAHVERLSFRDAGHGYDPLGFHPPALELANAANDFFYRFYFRVESFGIENLPKEGAAILAANHSTMVPIDGAMLAIDVLRRTDPPRFVRPIGDWFIPYLPIVGTAFARMGMASGSRGNVRHLLEAGELLLIFPEGTPGIAKGFSRRYQLQNWRVGHVEFAIRHRAPVVPVGVVGAEEAWPQLGRIEGFHVFRAPYLPVPASPLPLPTKLRFYYGEPIDFTERFRPEQADEPDVLNEAAAEVKAAVEGLLARGLAERKGWFR